MNESLYQQFTVSTASEPHLTSEKKAPPPTNRGVLCTGELTPVLKKDGTMGFAPMDNTVGFDWLQGTMSVQALDFCRALLPGDWVKAERGFYGYPEQEKNCGATIAYGVRGEVHLVLTGSALTMFRASGGDELALLQDLRARGFKPSRVDVAFDDRRGLLKLDRVIEGCRCNTVSSRFRQWKVDEPRAFGSDRPTGRTLYVGSPQSDSKIRIYDKGLERGLDVEEDFWVRLEIQLRDQNAAAALELIAAAGSFEPMAGVVAGLIDFKAWHADRNKQRVDRASWWESFLEGAKRASLPVARAVHSLSRAYGWLDKQVAPMLAAVMEAYGGDLAVIADLLESGRRRFRSHHRLLAASPA